jgi:hypothetical protein
VPNQRDTSYVSKTEAERHPTCASEMRLARRSPHRTQRGFPTLGTTRCPMGKHTLHCKLSPAEFRYLRSWLCSSQVTADLPLSALRRDTFLHQRHPPTHMVNEAEQPCAPNLPRQLRGAVGEATCVVVAKSGNQICEGAQAIEGI